MTGRPWQAAADGFERLGEIIGASFPGKLLKFWLQTVTCLRNGPRTTVRQVWGILVQQLYSTGVEAIPLTVILAFLLGGVITIEAATLLPRFGIGKEFGSIMMLLLIREISPLFVAFLVAGRTGSALASFLGTMKVDQEIDALETMGIDPLRFLVFPALIGSTVATLCLSLIFSLVAVLGGYFITDLLSSMFPQLLTMNLPFTVFVEKMITAFSPADFAIVLLKPMIFGSLIVLLSCYHGLSLGISLHEVPQGTSKAVVQTIIGVVLIDGIFAVLFVIPQLMSFVP